MSEKFEKLKNLFKRFMSEKIEKLKNLFKRYMTEKIQKHHGNHNCTEKSTNDECVGQASLTESEYIMHQALDLFAEKFIDDVNLHRFHTMVHVVFEKTRRMLSDLAILQKSEFHPDAVAKQNDMKKRYRRETQTQTQSDAETSTVQFSTPTTVSAFQNSDALEFEEPV